MKKYKYNIEKVIDEIINEDNIKLNLWESFCLFLFGIGLIFDCIKLYLIYLFYGKRRI